MTLYNYFSQSVEVHYKGYLISKAMLFSITTTILTITLPFFVAYRSRGFWLQTQKFYEQPSVKFNYDYLMMIETHDQSQPILCGDVLGLEINRNLEENCVEFLIEEKHCDDEVKICELNVKAKVLLPPDITAYSLFLILGFNYQLKTTCPLQMQSLAVISENLPNSASSYKYYGDLALHQTERLACHKYVTDTKYNVSLFESREETNKNVFDEILDAYFKRKVITKLQRLHSKTTQGLPGQLDLDIQIRIPETEVQYHPSLLQQFKWAWPQFLSLALIFHWIFNRVKIFVFNNRLLMAWEVCPWKKND